MGYNYEDERSELFTDAGQRLFLEMRDRAQRLLREAGAVRMSEMMRGSSGSSWTMLACADRMIELGEIREITTDVAGQDRVFVRARS